MREPTRGKYLLDVVLTDLIDLAKVTVLPEIADHKVVCIDLDLAVQFQTPQTRQGWDFGRADWQALQKYFETFQWRDVFGTMGASEMAGTITEIIMDALARYCPRKTIIMKSRAHPWIDETCEAAIREKCEASNTENFKETEIACTRTLTAAYLQYQTNLCKTISEMPAGESKKWWRLNRELLNKNPRVRPSRH